MILYGEGWEHEGNLNMGTNKQREKQSPIGHWFMNDSPKRRKHHLHVNLNQHVNICLEHEGKMAPKLVFLIVTKRYLRMESGYKVG